MARKRKATLSSKDNVQVKESESTNTDGNERDLDLKNIENQDDDSTDDEGINEEFTSDEDEELSFESDGDGNYVFNDNSSEDSSAEFDNSKSGEDEQDDDNEQDSDSDDVEEDSSSEEEEMVNNKSGPKENQSKFVKMIEKTKSDQDSVGPSNVENNSEFRIVKKKKKQIAKNMQGKLEQIKNSNDGKEDEYEDDTSDEEDIRNTVGNIPMHWYDDYKHIGYDWDAKKIVKAPKGDQIDDFLKKIEDPNFWRTVKDPQTGQDIILSESDIEIIKRINSGKIPDVKFNEYEPWIEWFTSEVEKMPITNVPDHKRSFLPSQSEKKIVSKMVHALKMGWMKTTEELRKEKLAKKGPKFYMLWETDTSREEMRRIHDPVSAPKRDLPGHAESYNPPPEYLFDEKEKKEWDRLKDEPYKRKLHFMPQKYNSLRQVPAYPRYVRERFLRCLDLYLCPRAKRMKLNIDAEYLIPKLPSPRDLQPFPTVESLIYKGHSDIIRSISIEPRGEYIVSGCDDTTVKIWEISTGRCIRTIECKDVVRSVAWCPNAKLSIIAIAAGQRLLLINPKVGDKALVKKTDDLLAEAPVQNDVMESDRIKTAVQWSVAEKDEQDAGIRIVLTHFKPIAQVTWHGRGDYFATVMPEGANRSALIHQLSKRRTQIPFSKSKGLVQRVLFHPIKPCFFVATQRHVRIYDLVKQELIKKLLTNSQWISNMAIHPKGDNLLVSTYDKKMLWFDLDLSTKPYQTIRLHKGAVRSVGYHLRYPLFASCSDDTSVIVSHGMVYNDLLQNPLIVPLKKLQTHQQTNDFGVLDVVWHPTQPWVFSSGADCTIRLYT